MRIAIGQQWQETNTFNPLPSTRTNFEQFGVSRGDEMLRQMATTNEVGGFLQGIADWPQKPEIIGLARLPAWPSGRATRETFVWLRDELVESLHKAMPVDAVLLSLHGAMVADDFPDVEGEILRDMRAIIGPKIPLVATLDLHANVTDLMVRMADALVLYHTAPHIDILDTGRRAAGVMAQILFEGARPVTAWQKIPMVVPAERANTEDSASISHQFKQHLQALESHPDVLTAGLATVQPWLDIPEMGTAVVVTTRGEVDLAVSKCREFADKVWQHRRDYLPTLTPVPEAVQQAHEITDGLVVLSDSADATTSGAPGDSNWVLEELVKYPWPRGALVTLVAPEVIEEAAALGVGSELNTPLGGVRDYRFSQPAIFHTHVERLFDARFVLSGHHLGKNLAINMGPSAVLRQGDVHIVLTSRTGPHFAPELFQTAGFDPFVVNVLVAKSPCGFRAAYAPHAKKILVVKAPGCAPSDFWHYEYNQIPRPLWPWDEIESWRAAPAIL
jgi:microcystin degradation protein MlrC